MKLICQEMQLLINGSEMRMIWKGKIHLSKDEIVGKWERDEDELEG